MGCCLSLALLEHWDKQAFFGRIFFLFHEIRGLEEQFSWDQTKGVRRSTRMAAVLHMPIIQSIYGFIALHANTLTSLRDVEDGRF